MATKQRPADAGTERGGAILADLRREARMARRDRGLSLADVGRAVGLSQAALSRFEHGETADVGMIRLARILAVVGLQLSARAYPGDGPFGTKPTLAFSAPSALNAHAAGTDPGGSSVIVMPRKLGR